VRQAKERDILALAEGQSAVLIGRGWEAPGFWRWEKTRAGRMVRAYYDASNPRNTVRIPSRDAPSLFRPHVEVSRPRAPEPKPKLEAALDIGAELSAFEAQLLQACRVDDALPDRERGMLRVRILWPATSSAPGDYPTGISTRFRPTRAQIDEWFAVMNSLKGAQVSPEAMLVIRLYARGHKFRPIGERIGRSESRTRSIYRSAVAEFWRASRRSHQSARERA